MLIDSHCHISLLSNEQLTEAKNSGYFFMATGGTHFENEKLIEINFNNFFNVLGVCYSEKCDIEKEIELIKNNRPYAIGEIGLDYYRVIDENERKANEVKFKTMLSLAEELNLPIVVHSRNAEARVLDVLNSYNLKVMMHCFSGDLISLKKCIDKNYLISIPPQINSRRKEIIKNTPLSNLVVESDAPALGGPLSARISVELISKVAKLAMNDVIFAANKNAGQFFGLGELNV